MIVPAVLISLLAIQSHAQTPASSPSYSVRSMKMERVGNTLTLSGDVVIVINGIEIRTDRAVMVLPPQVR
jgi:hypothetical protein